MANDPLPHRPRVGGEHDIGRFRLVHGPPAKIARGRGVETEHARGVTQIRWRGSDISTSVQAERQGPSMTTRSPDARTGSKSSRNGPTCPPGLATDAHFGRGRHGGRGDGRKQHAKNN